MLCVSETHLANFPVTVHPLLLAVEPQSSPLNVFVYERCLHLAESTAESKNVEGTKTIKIFTSERCVSEE